MQIISEIQISVKDIKKWISQSNSIHSLQSIRAKTNKRIKSLVQGYEESPFKDIPIKDKREVLKELFVDKVMLDSMEETKCQHQH